MVLFGLGGHSAIVRVLGKGVQGVRGKKKKEKKGMYYLIEISCSRDTYQNPLFPSLGGSAADSPNNKDCKRYRTDEKHIRNYPGAQGLREIAQEPSRSADRMIV